MNCGQAEKLILLRQSRELPRWNRWRLSSHQAQCPHCAAFAQDLAELTAHARADHADPHPQTLGHILAFAEQQAQRTRRRRIPGDAEPWFLIWRPAILYGALSVLLLVTFILLTHPARTRLDPQTPMPGANGDMAWNDQMDEQFENFSTIETDESSLWPSDSLTEVSDCDPGDINCIATELLKLEETQS
jgi:hypothetical protein